MSKDTPKQRTDRQNRSIHKFFTQVSDSLTAGGFTAQAVLSQIAGVSMSPYIVKEIWRVFQTVKLGKESTTELTTKDIDDIYDEMNLFLGERFGVHVPFPSNEIYREED